MDIVKIRASGNDNEKTNILLICVEALVEKGYTVQTNYLSHEISIWREE